MKAGRVTPADYATILDEHASFWGERDLRPAHHPALVHEFGDTSVALREDERLVGYLFGFVPGSGGGYVHLVGVREDYRRRGLATRLWEEFERLARDRGATSLKAITTPGNEMSIGFHSSLGMSVERVPGYAGPGHDRIVFTRSLGEGTRPGLDHVLVAVPMGASEQAKGFYGGLLGLEEMAKPEELEREGVWFDLGDHQLHIGEYEDFQPAQRAHPGLRLAEGDLDALAGRLEAAGSDVRWDDRLTDRRRFYTDDPWGNRLELLAYEEGRG